MAPPVEFEGIVLNRPQERQLMARREHSVSASTNRSVNNSPNAILARSDPRRLNASTPQLSRPYRIQESDQLGSSLPA